MASEPGFNRKTVEQNSVVINSPLFGLSYNFARSTMESSIKHKVLVTGANGQLGREFQLLARAFSDFDFVFADKMTLDVCLHQHVLDFVKELKPDAVINCAAYTNVEKAETEKKASQLANAHAPAFLAEACAATESLLIHFSTDYVFDGKKNSPYSEEDAEHPLSTYGRTKWEGEKLLDEKLKRHFIIRTSWLYSTFGHNFFKTMIRLAKEKGELTVVNDQVSSPTYARHMAEDVLKLLQKTIVRTEHVDHGIYHYAQEGTASWYDFTVEILKDAGISVPVHPVSSSTYLTRALRPPYSKLDNNKFIFNTGITPLHWKEGLASCMASWKTEHENQF